MSCKINYMNEAGDVVSLTDEEFVRAMEEGNLAEVLARQAGAATMAEAKPLGANDVADVIRSAWSEHQAIDAPTSEAATKVRSTIFDSLFPVENAIRKAGNSESGKRLRYVMRTYRAKAEYAKEQVEEKQLRPMVDAMAKKFKELRSTTIDYQKGGQAQFFKDLSDIGNLVMHGKERNAYILASKHLGISVEELSKLDVKQINGLLRAKGYDASDIKAAHQGSGMSDDQIDHLHKTLEARVPGITAFYNSEVAPTIKRILAEADERMIKAGLVTPEMVAARPQFEHYVPLKGDPTANDSEASPIANGVKLKTAKQKKAAGRSGTLADNLFQNVMATAASAAMAEQVQEFKYALIQFAKTPEGKAALKAKVNTADSKEIFETVHNADGTISERVKSAAMAGGDTIVFNDGVETTSVKIGDPAIVEALIAADKVDGMFASKMRAATRTLARIYTTWSLSFPLINRLRDSQSIAALAMADAPVADSDKAALVRDFGINQKYLLTAWKLGSKEGGARAEFEQWYDKLKSLGGMSLRADLLKGDLLDNLSKDFEEAVGSNNKAAAAKKYARLFAKKVEAYNNYFESTSRVAIFKALVDHGVSEEEAALWTKNTMNFEVSSPLSKGLGVIYPFIGPAVFDLQRLGRAMRSTRGKVWLGAQLAGFMALQQLAGALGGDDDDGIPLLAKFGTQEMGGNLLIPLGNDGSAVRIPIGFGMVRIANTIAASLYKVANGTSTPSEFVSDVLVNSILKNTSPVQPKDIDPVKNTTSFLAQTFAPAVFLPLLQLALNQNSQGGLIHKKEEWQRGKMNFQSGWPKTEEIYTDVAQKMHDIAGLDVHPESIKHLIRSYGGSASADVARLFSMFGNVLGGTPEEIGAKDIPIVQSFVSVGGNYDQKRFVEYQERIADLKKERAYLASKPDNADELAKFDESNGWLLALEPIYKRANAEIRNIKSGSKADHALDVGSVKEAKQAEQVKLMGVYKRVNAAAREATPLN